jgi:putative MATE family efflux protein
MKVHEKNLTVGSEISAIVLFTLPMLAGNLFQQLYNVVDSVIVGRYIGADALAAVGATGSVTYLFYTLCLGLGTGAGILTAQHYGSGDEHRVKKIIVNSAYVIGIFAVIISTVSLLLTRHLLILLNTPDSVLEAAVGYMRISCAGTVAVAAYNWIAFILRALGDSKTPLIFLVISSLLNVVLDLFFILSLGMGINGAALATVIAQGISAAASIAFAFVRSRYFKFSTEHIRPDKSVCKKCILTGVPIALQNAMISLSMISLQRTANSFGEKVMAAYTASMRVEQLIQQPYASLGSAMSTFTGQNYGAGKNQRIKKGYRQSVLLVLGFSAVMTSLFLIFSKSIAGFFVDEQQVISIAAKGLRLNCLFYFFLGMIHLTRGLLNGIGDVNFALINGFCEVAGRIGFSYLLARVLTIGYISVWGTTALTWALTMLLCVARYLGIRGKIGLDRGVKK